MGGKAAAAEWQQGNYFWAAIYGIGIGAMTIDAATDVITLGGKAVLKKAIKKGAKEGLEATLKKGGKEVLGETLEKATPKMCFVAGTQVKTTSGTTAIEEIRPGDMVWSRSDQTGAEGFKPVVQVFVTHPIKLIHLSYRMTGHSKQTAVSVRGGNDTGGSKKIGDKGSGDDDDDESDGKIFELVGTAEHPFWVMTENRWVEMGDLQPRDQLRLSNGEIAEVVGSWIEYAPEGRAFTTYNFEVKDWHTYFVNPIGSAIEEPFVWVHNNGKKLCIADMQEAIKAVAEKRDKVLPEILQKASTEQITQIREIAKKLAMFTESLKEVKGKDRVAIGQALGKAGDIMKNSTGSAEHKADLFHALTKKISEVIPGFASYRGKSVDGELHVFMGAVGESTVITADGTILRGTKGLSAVTPIQSLKTTPAEQLKYNIDFRKLVPLFPQ